MHHGYGAHLLDHLRLQCQALAQAPARRPYHPAQSATYACCPQGAQQIVQVLCFMKFKPQAALGKMRMVWM